ncbi:MAG: GAF domain-containing sensor histidine kinase [Roseofilum sp. SBFL]|uniref:sensor histidine kinase n=1 Tax=unclassified Roseofilum TaxID=2620099 RepID=UPI001B191A24|nr:MULTISPECIES: ATP-binding protein [unclassified Roseofilum]MBP0015039.1 GAF domain-containing sensor histidine kinase [Roseofilum sp. SID3]MBP0037998.1 GAF domain-containing sensor histidine kinase [Roseofilum sp. SID1]MBP0041128.1 GAF domain-containing sensor histidine kinase [Roseofilum sp. SBFL]
MTLTWNQAGQDVRCNLSSDRLIYYRLLTEAISKIRSSLDLDTILNTTVLQLREVLNTDRAAIFQFNSDLAWHGEVICEYLRSPWKPATSIQVYDHCFGEQFAAEYLKGRISAIPDIYAPHISDCHREILAQFQVRANLVAPLVKGNELWGLLCIHECGQSRVWTETEIEFVSQISQQLGVAIQQASLLEKTKKQAQELRQTLDRLQRTQAQMIQNEKMVSLGNLVAGVAHEINNPVSFIYGNLGYIQEHATDLLELLNDYQQTYPDPVAELQESLEDKDVEFIQEDLQKILTSMKSGTERIKGIVASLRNFSRMDEAQMKSVDIHEGIDSTLVILNHRLEGKENRPEIPIFKDYGDLPLIDCYPAQLNQVFMYLLSNAIDALDEKIGNDRYIKIKTEIEGANVRISIADNGNGIPESIRSQVFDPFFTTKPPGKGTGLGLSICYTIVVEKHQGRLWYDSSPGEGTRFTIELQPELSNDPD